MSVIIDLTGQRFGKWTVLGKAENDKHGASRWYCRCDCGKERVVLGNNLRKGTSKGCGCDRSGANFIDLTGQRFGRWTVLRRSSTNKKGCVLWVCRCDCGEEREVLSRSLLSHRSTSCGCFNKDKATIHGKTNTRIFNIWEGMRKRCNNPNHKYYKDYGGRGIKVCTEWEHDFQNFYNYVSQLPHFNESGYSLDRWPNKDGNYEPGNVRWTTQKEQCRNKRNNFMIGNKSLAQICEELKLPYGSVWRRIKKYGWSVDQAISTPVKKYNYSRGE